MDEDLNRPLSLSSEIQAALCPVCARFTVHLITDGRRSARKNRLRIGLTALRRFGSERILILGDDAHTFSRRNADLFPVAGVPLCSALTNALSPTAHVICKAGGGGWKGALSG